MSCSNVLLGAGSDRVPGDDDGRPDMAAVLRRRVRGRPSAQSARRMATGAVTGDDVDVSKFAVPSSSSSSMPACVLVACGSFSPVTNFHLRLFGTRGGNVSGGVPRAHVRL